MKTTTLVTKMTNSMKQMFKNNGAISPEDADAIGDMIADTANYFESHPHVWLKAAYSNDAKTKFCNVGLMDPAYGSDFAKHFTLVQRAAWHRQDRIAGTMIDLNDHIATSLAANVMGLRYLADVLYRIAVGEKWNVALQTVEAEYLELYGSQTSIGKGESQARREAKNAQVRAARKAAKLRGYKSVTQLRKAGYDKNLIGV